MKIKFNPRSQALTFIEVLIAVALITIFTLIIISSYERRGERMRLGVVFSQFEVTRSLAGTVFKVEHIFTNSHKQIIFLGETTEGEKSTTFLSNLPEGRPVSLTIGKFYTPTTVGGFVEVIGSATDSAPTTGQQSGANLQNQ